MLAGGWVLQTQSSETRAKSLERRAELLAARAIADGVIWRKFLLFIYLMMVVASFRALAGCIRTTPRSCGTRIQSCTPDVEGKGMWREAKGFGVSKFG